MIDGVSITADREYTTGTINKIYGETGDSCFDDFYNNATGAYRYVIDAFLKSV